MPASDNPDFGRTKQGDRSPLTDSPWFWAYLFATGAIVALLLGNPKYRQRQPQIERQFKARQEGGQAVTGPQGPVDPSTSEDLIISLRPLYIAMLLAIGIAWVGLWYRRIGRPADMGGRIMDDT